mmetsp:Transcript_73072/g.167572  ORF Transcript_73072/g.167572 Transcript_73072/m.167572 type:complete len:426 (+) Transcript_73072:1286-2563(+)
MPAPTCICMVSDCFLPSLGGVEVHIFQLSQCLRQLGYKVIVVTHARGCRTGIRYMSDGLKVFYLPFVPFLDNCTLPTLWSSLPLFRQVLFREGVDIVHGHQATSTLALECMLHAAVMGLRTVFTDHSCFSFADAASIHANKLLKYFLAHVDSCISVSHTNRENLVLRANLAPEDIYVIPNAIDGSCFVPDPQKRPSAPIVNVVAINRLTHRKGIDLLADVIPIVCRSSTDVKWTIGGDGPKRAVLEDMIDAHALHDRVVLLGMLPHDKVRDVLKTAHVFVNCSLTEAFCIAIVEAACAGCQVVATDVGGVHEVLPPDILHLAPASAADLAAEVLRATDICRERDPHAVHQRAVQMYNWSMVAERTSSVYLAVISGPSVSLGDRVAAVARRGTVAGPIFALMLVLTSLLHRLLAVLFPYRCSAFAN